MAAAETIQTREADAESRATAAAAAEVAPNSKPASITTTTSSWCKSPADSQPRPKPARGVVELPAGGEPATSGAASNGRKQQAVCAGCGRPIRERFLLEALGCQWHEDCLKCACCECRLGEVGSSLYLAKPDMILCRRDYLRIFGQQGCCATCKRPIPAYELVMRARGHTYHLDCFACHQCRYRFCVGDKFHLSARNAEVICTLCHAEPPSPPAAGLLA